MRIRNTAREGLLRARLSEAGASAEEGKPGLYDLKIDGTRDGLLYVPDGYVHGRPAPLAVMLHGAGGNARQGISLLQSQAAALNMILVAPESREGTWDVIRGGYGPDVTYIDQALARTFSRYTIDPSHLAVGGFSDGASYALSLGITNGDLFTHIVAFSPGFMAPARREGSPRIFISHGTRDQVLPVNQCSRRIVPQLEDAGYDVTYLEFDGPHTIPPEIARAGAEWFAGQILE